MAAAAKHLRATRLRSRRVQAEAEAEREGAEHSPEPLTGSDDHTLNSGRHVAESGSRRLRLQVKVQGERQGFQELVLKYESPGRRSLTRVRLNEERSWRTFRSKVTIPYSCLIVSERLLSTCCFLGTWLGPEALGSCCLLPKVLVVLVGVAGRVISKRSLRAVPHCFSRF